MDDHMKAVAKRHANDKKKYFFKLLGRCGWSDEKIEEMWAYCERHKTKEGREEVNACKP